MPTSLRDDHHVLDAARRPDIPIPVLRKYSALYDATKAVSGMPGEEVKQRPRTERSSPRVDDRNWSFVIPQHRRCDSIPSQGRAIDMESATMQPVLAASAPYGTPRFVFLTNLTR